MADFEILKEPLGEELFAQVTEKLQGIDNLRLVNAADGSYVPKEKMDQLTQSNGQYKKQISELNAKLDEIRASVVDAEELKKQLADAQNMLTQREDEMKRQSVLYRAKDAVREAKARNPEAVLKLIDMSRVSDDNGNLLGINEQLEALKKTDAYLFEDEHAESGGVDPHRDPSGKPQSVNDRINQAIREAAGY